MARSEHVPGTEDGCVHSAVDKELFTFRANLNVGLHHGRGVGDAEVDEMRDARFFCGLDGSTGGDEIDLAELVGFGGAGVCYSYQLNESV